VREVVVVIGEVNILEKTNIENLVALTSNVRLFFWASIVSC